MTIEELADILRIDIIVKRYADQDGQYIAYFEGVEIKASQDGLVLVDEYGTGINPQEAIDDFAKRISGKLLVIDSNEGKQTFGVPRTVKWSKPRR